MSSQIIAGGQISKDPSDKLVLGFNWSSWLAATAELVNKGTFTVTSVQPREDPVTLTVDQDSLLTGNQSVQFRLVGGRRGTRYNVAHKITTNESPAQEAERSFFVLVEDK